MSSLKLYETVNLVQSVATTTTTLTDVDDVRKNFISPEVRAKIMTGRLFTKVEDGEDWPDFGYFYYASRWTEIYECLDDDALDAYLGPTSSSSTSTGGAHSEAPSLSWFEWDELLRGHCCGRSFCEADSLVLSPVMASSRELPARSKGRCFDEEERRWSTEDFSSGVKLGRGAFGIVYAVRERQSGYVVAIKVMDKQMIENRKCTLQIQREMQLQFGLAHENICRLYDHFDDENRFYLIMEFAPNGTLAQLLKALAPTRCLPEPLSARFIRMLASGLDYIHALGIIHRDIKPENLLLGYGNILKLADFGWAVPERDASACTVFCGTEEYLAPEMLKRLRVTTQLDMWCTGVVLYEMLVGRTPFRGTCRTETFCGILRGEFGFSVELSVGARVLVMALLCQKPEMRLTAERVWYDRWVREQAEEV